MVLHVRIDDRLLHGQVIHGVVPHLRATTVIVADDRAARDDWERETYLAARSDELDVEVLDLGEAASRLTTGSRSHGPVLLLVRGPCELLELESRGLEVEAAVVGGLHRAPGRKPFAEDLQIGPSEARAFVALTNAGVHCYYQPLPTDEPSELPDLTRAIEEGSGT